MMYHAGTTTYFAAVSEIEWLGCSLRLQILNASLEEY